MKVRSEPDSSFTNETRENAVNISVGSLYRQLAKSKKIIFVLFPSLLSGACLPCVYILTGKVLNAHVESIVTHIDPMDKIEQYCIWMAVLAVILAVVRFIDNFLWIQIGVEFSSNLKSKLFSSLMRSDVTFFDQNTIGSLLTLFGDDAKIIEDSFGTIKGIQSQNFGIFFSCNVGMCFYNWRMALIMTALIPFFMITVRTISRFINSHTTTKFESESAAITIAEEAISAIRTVRSFNREDKEIKRFIKKSDETDSEAKKINNLLLILVSTIVSSLWIVVAGNLYYGGTFVRDGKMLSGDFFTCFGFMALGGLGVIELMTSVNGEQKAIASGLRLLEYIEKAPSQKVSESDIIENFKGKIEFVNVSFKYPT